MADEVDNANETAEKWLKIRLEEQAAAAKANRLQPKGVCYYCETELTGKDADKRLFCDKDCAADYDEEQRLLKRR